MVRLLKASEVSSMLGIHVIYLYKLVHDGKIDVVRIGRRGIRFSETEIERWLDTQNKGTTVRISPVKSVR